MFLNKINFDTKKNSLFKANTHSFKVSFTALPFKKYHLDNCTPIFCLILYVCSKSSCKECKAIYIIMKLNILVHSEIRTHDLEIHSRPLLRLR